MTLKSLLLGTAAAFAVVTGAQAADAIVAAAPEPMDYVKVCDAFGTGYFYIPGTETCLKIGGLARLNIGAQTGQNSWGISDRAQVQFDTANDSEMGKVYSMILLRAEHVNNGSTTFYSEYKAGIGGFEFGNNGGKYDAIAGGFTDNGGTWGGHSGQYVAYNFNAGNVGGYISLDNDASLNNYLPDLSAGVNFTAGDAYGALGIGYDESLSSVALKGNLGAKYGSVGVRIMGAYSNNALNQYWGHNGWSLGAGVSADVASNLSVAADYQYLNDTNSSAIYGDIIWKVAPGFKVLGEVGYTTVNSSTAGFVRFERTF